MSCYNTKLSGCESPLPKWPRWIK